MKVQTSSEEGSSQNFPVFSKEHTTLEIKDVGHPKSPRISPTSPSHGSSRSIVVRSPKSDCSSPGRSSRRLLQMLSPSSNNSSPSSSSRRLIEMICVSGEYDDIKYGAKGSMNTRKNILSPISGKEGHSSMVIPTDSGQGVLQASFSLSLDTEDILDISKTLSPGRQLSPSKRSNGADDKEGLFDLQEYILPDNKKYRFRRFARGQIFGYCLLFLFLGIFLAVLISFVLIEDQGKISTELTTTEVHGSACVGDNALSELCEQRLRELNPQNNIGRDLSPIRGLREVRQQRLIESLPAGSVDLWSFNLAGENLSKNKNESKSVEILRPHLDCFNKSMLLSIRDEFQRTLLLQRLLKSNAFRERLTKSTSGGEGWSRNQEGVYYNFQRNISLSYRSLEEFVSEYDPKLRIGKRETVRQYIERIKRRYKDIDATHCEQYISLYEEAVYGSGKDFDMQKYNLFLKHFTYMAQFLSRNSTPFSVRSLVSYAKAYDDSLQIKEGESIREYVDRIQQRCKDIDVEACNGYVKGFEKAARYGKGSFDESELAKFKDCFIYMVTFFSMKKKS